jgi:hypothetical protein
MVRMNLKPTVEEDTQWKMFINMDKHHGNKMEPKE